MRALLAAALLLAPAAALARGAAARPARIPAAAKAADGTDLPIYAASTAPVTVALVRERFAELDARMVTLGADFQQFVTLDGADASQEVAGTVLFKTPDLMRLTQRLPEPQTVVSDGTWLWVHRPSTNQVIKSRLADWRRSQPLAKGLLDFGRTAGLLDRYAAVVSTVSAPGPDGYRTFVVTLTPKGKGRDDDASFTLALTASTKDFFPARSDLRVGRAEIRSRFENVRLNPALPDGDFRFTPPAGADVFTAPAAP